MPIKGLVLTKELIDKIIDYDIKKITLKELEGLDIFNSFNFNNFKKKEIELIINAFKILNYKTKIFNNLSKRQEFYINLDCGIYEFDLITVLNYQEKRIVFNIEVKDLDNNEEIEKQVKKRTESHIPILFPGYPVLSLGFNNDFVIAYYKYKDGIKKLII